MPAKYGKWFSIAIFIVIAILCAFGIGKYSRDADKEAKEYRLRKEVIRQDSITQIVVKQDAQLKEEYENLIKKIITKQKGEFKTNEQIESAIPDSLTDVELRRAVTRILLENGNK